MRVRRLRIACCCLLLADEKLCSDRSSRPVPSRPVPSRHTRRVLVIVVSVALSSIMGRCDSPRPHPPATPVPPPPQATDCTTVAKLQFPTSSVHTRLKLTISVFSHSIRTRIFHSSCLVLFERCDVCRRCVRAVGTRVATFAAISTVRRNLASISRRSS
ncbi:hypothetical protein V9T40_005494 [Parthenolecanium corni]|uniref:Secreted protein n=1 Tax=Parthenolecanium corni TaxID=536013 RepID=A0AAN9TF68_9HEMI